MIQEMKLKKLMADQNISDEDKLKEIERRELEIHPGNTSTLMGLMKAKAKVKKTEE